MNMRESIQSHSFYRQNKRLEYGVKEELIKKEGIYCSANDKVIEELNQLYK